MVGQVLSMYYSSGGTKQTAHMLSATSETSYSEEGNLFLSCCYEAALLYFHGAGTAITDSSRLSPVFLSNMYANTALSQ